MARIAHRPVIAGARRAPRRFRGHRQQHGHGRARLFGVVAIVAIGLIGYALAPAGRAEPGKEVAAQVIYTAPTSNDARVVLPDGIKDVLRDLGRRHEKIALTRVEATGTVDTSIVDLTPRIGDEPSSPVIKVEKRAAEAVHTKIDQIETAINTRSAQTGGRSLYVGLLKTHFAGAEPTYIVSGGLDLTDPADFRKLAFDVPASQVAIQVTASGEVPELANSPVTFVLVPPAGDQEQLRRPQRDYVKAVWSALLTAGGASSVSFIDAPGAPAAATIAAPAVPLPDLPGTPLVPRTTLGQTTCELSTSTYFAPDTPVLVDRAATIADLRDCAAKAGPGTTVALDAWTAYYGPLDAAGQPASNPHANISLSEARNKTIADLLVRIGIGRAAITRMTGHGSADQPDPRDPGSARNRVVRITITTTKQSGGNRS